MSAIGRIFIVLNLILAAAFVGVASQAIGGFEEYRTMYNDEVEAHAAAVEEKEAEISQLRTEVSSLTEGQRTFREERDDLQARVTDLEGQLADAKRQNSELSGQIAGINATLGDYNATIAQLDREKTAAVQRAHEAESARDEALAQSQQAEMGRRDASDELAAANRTIAELEKSAADLQSKVSRLDTEIQTIVATYGVPRTGSAMPQIEAAVLNASFDTEPGLVMLNVGKQNDVKRGYTFHIYRGSQYKGQVRVENVQDQFCSAVVVGLKEGTTITQGDRATTIL